MKPARQLFAPGQQWVSEAEPELGMGTLEAQDRRTVTLAFPLAGCTRQYARGSAPLKRVRFKPGDRIRTRSGKEIRVADVREDQGLIRYFQGETMVPEQDLSVDMQFSLPQERLLAGLGQGPHAFDLRLDILKQRSAYELSPARGFLGGRIDLIPHQFYIAGEMTARHSPRVLLSDETGLGKTIEACLILHRLLVCHRISRVLIIVPDPLVHQWFVELYRKFNLSFRIVDPEHCRQAALADKTANPFLDDQLCLSSQAFILSGDRQKDQILSAGWDMVVMDEAHHILDDRGFFGFMQALGQKTDGLMLLSATPEQMGEKTYFSQLSLLDPDRYFDFGAYKKEAAGYEKTAQKVRSMIREGRDPKVFLDSHGPGRVIFRNTRSRIKGFPERFVRLMPLAGKPAQVHRANQAFASPETVRDTDFLEDPRIDCLARLAREIKPEKILVICASKAKSLAVENALKTRISIDAARFDETMSLMQRDRAAAWFAKEDGARMLICSEIGSEGRNFQFVHHLFLFDLPESPELLEQRIGRVDRIGQVHDITLHVPYVENAVYQVLARWYMEGLNLLEKNVNGVHGVTQRYRTRVSDLIRETADAGKVPESKLSELTWETHQYCRRMEIELSRGKNILLELNSLEPDRAERLISRIRKLDKDPGLPDLMCRVLDYYGIDADPSGPGVLTLSRDRPADEGFPALPRNAHAVTFDRETAIAREEIPFFNWDHPFVNRVLDYFITKGEGICALARPRDETMPEGVFLEAVFLLEGGASPGLNPERFLPRTPVRVLVDHSGSNRTGEKWADDLGLASDTPNWFQAHEGFGRDLLPLLLDAAKTLARKQAAGLIRSAGERVRTVIGSEIARLETLQKINPSIRPSEITAAREEMDRVLDGLSRTDLRLDALRLIRSVRT